MLARPDPVPRPVIKRGKRKQMKRQKTDTVSRFFLASDRVLKRKERREDEARWCVFSLTVPPRLLFFPSLNRLSPWQQQQQPVLNPAAADLDDDVDL